MALRAYELLVRKLWPTERRFEWRHGEVMDQLSAVRAALDAQPTRADLAALRAAVDQLAARQEQIYTWQAEMVVRLRRSQALTARVYEHLHGWPALLEDARSQASYELAYQDPDPLISIPIPTYHSPDTLCERALASVRAQTHTNWEAIVVGDHCTDDTEDRVRALGDDRIRFVNLPVRENDPLDPWESWAVRGSVPRSTGIELAAGRWIAPLSHDDAWDVDHLATLLDGVRASHAELVYSRMRVLDAEQAEPAPIRSCGAWPPRLGDYAFQAAMFHGGLRFLRYDRSCALASEPNDWNLARRAWEAGVRFHFVDRETATLFLYPRGQAIQDAYAAMGMPPSATAIAFR
jgi:hypothetical protein